MLEPLDRSHLLNALRPPEGYEVELAIGTTYTLDLMALLSVPLAFALFDWEDESGKVSPNPLALLEAARRYAGKTHIFCQAGQIHLPRQRSPLFYELERVVKQVRSPHPRGIFHPKLWILRFISNSGDDSICYRVLCLSRNLTFDRSWDTLLRLDGVLVDRDRAISANHPLGDFIKALPGLMISAADKVLINDINRIQDEIRRVRFELPEGIEEIKFHPIGLTSQGDWWFGGRSGKILAMAPFVDGVFLKRMATLSKGNGALVSRLEQLRELPGDLLCKCEKVYYLHPEAADGSPDSDGRTISEEESTDPTPVVDPHESLSGLHAKLFITDAGWQSSVWTGSANATNAAFSRNVEFLVELVGKKGRLGVDAFLSKSEGVKPSRSHTRFVDLLHEYQPDSGSVEVDADAKAAEALAEKIQREIVHAQVNVTVTQLEQSVEFKAYLSRTESSIARIDPSSVSIRFWPVTLQSAQSMDATALIKGDVFLWPRISFEALTTFWAFEVTAKNEKKSHTLAFVLNLPVQGMPVDRSERLLHTILQNKSNVMRLLLLLLADSGNNLLAGLSTAMTNTNSPDGKNHEYGGEQWSLLEPLLKILESSPVKLKRIDRLLRDLKKTPNGESLLPDGFDDVWYPVWAVAERMLNEQNRPQT